MWRSTDDITTAQKNEDVIRPDGAIKYGIDTVPPIVGRGVLLDMAGAAGVAMLPGGTVFNRKELEAVQEREGIRIRKGDVVLINTGWLSMQEADRKTGFSTTPGLGEEGAEYLAELGVVAVGQDAWIPDAMPAEDPTNFLPVHSILLVRHGVHILENIKTEELAAEWPMSFSSYSPHRGSRAPYKGLCTLWRFAIVWLFRNRYRQFEFTTPPTNPGLWRFSVQLAEIARGCAADLFR